MRSPIFTTASLVVVMMAAGFGCSPRIANAGDRKACWDQDGPARIWPEIGFRQAADLDDYRRTMSQSRDQVRRMLTQELIEVVRELAPTGGNPKEIVESVLSAIMAFDDVHDRHKEKAVKGMPIFLEVSFRTAVDGLYRSNRIPVDQRRIRLVNLALVNRLKAIRDELQSDRSVKKGDMDILGQVVGAVDLVPYATFSSNGPRHQVTLTLENVRSGAVCNFEGTGDLEQVGYLLAEAVFRDFQAVSYPEIRNPNPHLTWIPSSPGHPLATGAQARNYCSSQGSDVRLPFALELTTAASVGVEGASYVKGGIPRLEPGPWVVADRLHEDDQYYYFEPRPGAADNHPAGPIRTDAGLGRVNARYWCVEGKPDPRVVRIDELYKVYRRVRWADPRSPALAAVEYLLSKEEALGARKSYPPAFPNEEAAWAVIQEAGYTVAGARGQRPKEGPGPRAIALRTSRGHSNSP
jgi:hypothetical protein